jgi:hypothetical protein
LGTSIDVGRLGVIINKVMRAGCKFSYSNIDMLLPGVLRFGKR